MDPEVCLKALFPVMRRAVLASMLMHSEKWWYLTELATTLGKSPSSLQRELYSLRAAGLLECRTQGRRVYFRMRRSSRIVRGLQEVFDSALTCAN